MFLSTSTGTPPTKRPSTFTPTTTGTSPSSRKSEPHHRLPFYNQLGNIMLEKALIPLAIILSACSGGNDSGGPDEGEGPVSNETVEAFCDDYAAAICENERICCSEGGDEDCE